MDQNSAAKLTKVHPRLSILVAQLISNLANLGMDVRVVQGLRTFAEQDALYAQGRTRPGKRVTNARGGQSNHNYGFACDLAPFKDGKPNWNDINGFKTIGREAKKLGLEWGGDWKFTDMPHVQLKGLSVKECFALYNKGGLSWVWRRMDEILGGAPKLSYTPVEDDILEFGDNGPEVRKLQQDLVKLNYLRSHEVDGEFGKITKNAVIGFQRQNNLTSDGIVGPGTKAKIKAAIEANSKIFQNLQPAEIDSTVVPSLVKDSPSVSTDLPAAVENSGERFNSTNSSEQPPINQTAEQITNIDQSAKTVPDNFMPEIKTVEAPPKENSTATAAKLTIGGFAVPTALLAIIQTVKDLVSQGYINAQDVGNSLLQFVQNNTRYVFYLIGLIIIGLLLKKAYKQITLWIQMYFAGKADTHDVEVKPQ